MLFNDGYKIWTDRSGKETLSYDVMSGDNNIGTYIMTGENITAKTVSVGGEELEGRTGLYFTSRLDVTEIKDGKSVRTVMTTQSLLSTSFVVEKSYRKTQISITDDSGTDIQTTEINGSYDDKKYHYTVKQTSGDENIKDENGTLSHSKFASTAYIDNDFMYQAVRLLAAVGSNLSFQVPYYNYTDGVFSTVTMEKVASSVTANNTSITNLRGDFALPEDSEIVYTGSLLSISLSRSFPGSGTAFTCYVLSAKTNPADNTQNEKYSTVPAKIKEGDIEYILTSISNT